MQSPLTYLKTIRRLTSFNSRTAPARMKTQLTLAGTLAFLLLLPLGARSQHLLLEAEQFADPGGWDLDQQSMQSIGSPYLLAHGLGVPVKDALTTAKFPSPGAYRVWVRTRDWVAPWKAPGAPGKFQVVVNGKPLNTIFGTKGAEWHWQDGGTVQVGPEAKVALHDLTGFEGRCDAVLFSRDADFIPPNEAAALAAFRQAALGLPAEPEDGGEFDLVVVGGGIAGTSAAISAARNGLRVALVQDRPVLGGNGSSEVRVWPEGHTRQKPYPHIGEIVEELVPAKQPGTGNAKHGGIYGDQGKLDLVRAEPRVTLLLEQQVYAVRANGGRIESVDAQHIRTARRIRLRAKLFADCTGDATVGYLAGADHETSKEGQMGASNLWNLMDNADPAQVLKCECKDKDALTIAVKEGGVAAPFPRCPWAVDLTDKPFPGRKNFKGQWADTPLSNLGGWFWESGFQLDMVNDIERIRDMNFRAMYGAWDTLKNVDKLYPNHRLGWAAFIAGKRESRRLLGDVVLTGDDFRKGREWPDGAFPCSWHIDIHTPHPSFDKGHAGNEFISQATTGDGFKYKSPYWAPYRALYSRNVTNLFMAGRNISVDREGLGPVRVMRTCGMMGEIIGKAAWIAVRHETSPRGVYERHLPLLKELMIQPGNLRRDSLKGTLSRMSSGTPDEYDFNAMIQPVPATASFSDSDFNIWCGSATKGDDGKYHMFYSRWPRKLGHLAWVTHSEVAHAVSSSPFGPWKHHDVALPARGTNYWDGSCTHNPTVVRTGGKYYLYYMGNFGDGVVGKSLNWTHRNHQRIGVAVADSPNGPWQRFDKPLVDTTSGFYDALCCNNPSVAMRPDGGCLMVYKAVGDKGKMPFGGPVFHCVATSDSPTGPFRKHPNPIFVKEGVQFAAEDPFIWRGADRYWAVVKDNAGHFTQRGYSLALWESANGIDWKLARHPLVTTPEVTWADGRKQKLDALERPQVLLDNGVPIALLCAAADAKGRDGSFNIQIPLKGLK
jgi:hypothetical protein